MQIHSVTRFIAAPFILALVYVFYQSSVSYEFRDAYGFLVFPLVIIAVAFYIFSPQIDFWYHEKYPVNLDKQVVEWLEKHFPFYQQLNEDEQQQFRERLSLFMEAKEFSMMKQEMIAMPEDMKMIISAHAISVSFAHEDYLLNRFDRIIAYTHPFPTPFYKHLHNVEVEENDGVVLFNFEQIISSLRSEPSYNVALHGFIEAYLIEWGLEELQFTNNSENKLQGVSTLTSDQINQTTGFDRAEQTTVALHHFLKYNDKVKEKEPELYKEINTNVNMYSNNGRRK